ncbi:EglC Endo-1,3-1,4-beta-glycanase [Babesia caballi]|uniref:EglC Endo-1,3-1,4-beta-glycanase n=1 Tax=Babesia caballi TaxID=5871 RepID=A0AAV4LPM8_BABCB|nr:EglC Endo-1,3-1,4-beta-glycanase [Babesia caballi]
MAHGAKRALSKMIGSARLLTAKTFQVVGQEGLEGGWLIGTGTAPIMFAQIGTGSVAVGAAFITLSGTDVGHDVAALYTRINIFSKRTLVPAAGVTVRTQALPVQKVQLELQGVGVVGECVEKRRTGWVL